MSKSPIVVALLLGLVVSPLASGCGDKKDKDKSSKKDKGDDDDDDKKKSKSTVDVFKRRSWTNEAKNGIGAITRGAVGAFERESVAEPDSLQAAHVLCKSATPVPAKIPSGGESYQPKSEPGVDFEAGDAATGWPCLKFTVTNAVRFQYSYTVGGTPKLAARGKDVAKGDASFFEVCAEADFEPGGKTTLICQTGQVKKETDSVRIGSEWVELGEDE